MAEPTEPTNSTNEIFRAYNYQLEIKGLTVAQFTEVSGLSVNIEVIKYRDVCNGPVRKIPGHVDYGNVTLKYGLTENRELWDWLKSTIDGAIEPKSVSIIMLHPDGMSENSRWNLVSAWPSAWRGAELNALGQQVAIETLTLAHEGIERA